MQPSKSQPTAEQLEKLPKWAQDSFRHLTSERDEAVALVKKTLDTMTPSPIRITDHACLGEACGPSFLTRYVQSREIEITWKGIRLTIDLKKQSSQFEDGIRLSWESSQSGKANQFRDRVGFHPESYNAGYLLHPLTVAGETLNPEAWEKGPQSAEEMADEHLAELGHHGILGSLQLSNDGRQPGSRHYLASIEDTSTSIVYTGTGEDYETAARSALVDYFRAQLGQPCQNETRSTKGDGLPAKIEHAKDTLPYLNYRPGAHPPPSPFQLPQQS